MSSGEQVSKKVLIDQIRRTIIDGESKLLTILTDDRRSIMFRFSEGKLIRSHCRSRNVEDAIAALNECQTLKFTEAATQPQNQPELIAAEDFLQAIALDEFLDRPIAAVDTVPEPRQLVEKVKAFASRKSQPASSLPIDPALQGEVIKIASEYIGIVADVLVPKVFSKELPVAATIDEIAVAIPVPEYATAFRQRVMGFLIEANKKGIPISVEKKAEPKPEVKAEPEHRLFF